MSPTSQCARLGVFSVVPALLVVMPVLGQEIGADDPAQAIVSSTAQAKVPPEMTRKTRRAAHLIAFGVSLAVGATVPRVTVGRDCIGDV